MAKVTFSTRESEFSKILRNRVDSYFSHHSIQKEAPIRAYIKAWLLITLSITLYLTLTFTHLPNLIVISLCALEGILLAGVGFNVMHDGVHGNFSKNKKINSLYSLSMDFLGACSNFYKFQHTIVHHTFTNIPGHDADLEVGALMRLTPQQERLPAHRFQHFYAPFLYLFASLAWVWESDYRVLRTQRYLNHQMRPLTREDQLNFFFFKGVHILLTLVLPSFFHPILGVLGCYLLIQFVGGLILGHVFQMGHVFQGTDYPEPTSETQQIETNWFIHQIQTTHNIAPTNKLLSLYLGGLNHQIEHHLFPRVHGSHLFFIAPIVKETCAEFGIPYHYSPTLWDALKRHYKQLYQLGNSA